MKRGQITRCESERIRLNYCYNYQNYDVSIRVKYQGRYAKQVRRRRRVIIKPALILCITVLLSMVVAFGMFDTKSKACESEGSDIRIEENEAVTMNEWKEISKEVRVGEAKENDAFSIQAIRAPIVIAEVTPKETEVAETEATIKETEPVVTEEVQEETEPVSVASQEEYKPMKLAEYEISATEPYENFVYILSEEDMVNIAKLVWMEARGESYDGKVAVAAVVLNRYFSTNPLFYRSSILATLTQPTQFASISGVTEWDLNNVPDCLKAVEDACKGWDPTRAVFEEGALYFYNPNGVSGYQAYIRENIKVMVIGNHNFHFDFEKIGE